MMTLLTRARANTLLVKSVPILALLVGILLYSQGVLAQDGDKSLGTLADTITGSFGSIAKLLVALCYIAGIGFAAAGILKFKQHKDNPTQVTLGAPLALIFIAAALIWLPAIIQSTGGTVFGDPEAGHGTATGVDIFDDSE